MYVLSVIVRVGTCQEKVPSREDGAVFVLVGKFPSGQGDWSGAQDVLGFSRGLCRCFDVAEFCSFNVLTLCLRLGSHRVRGE